MAAITGCNLIGVARAATLASGFPLQQITGVHQHHVAGMRGPDRIDDCRGSRETVRAVGAAVVVVPGPESAMDVGGGDHDQRPRHGTLLSGQSPGDETLRHQRHEPPIVRRHEFHGANLAAYRPPLAPTAPVSAG